jgi:hypothetical protein
MLEKNSAFIIPVESYKEDLRRKKITIRPKTFIEGTSDRNIKGDQALLPPLPPD